MCHQTSLEPVIQASVCIRINLSPSITNGENNDGPLFLLPKNYSRVISKCAETGRGKLTQINRREIDDRNVS